MNLEQDARKTLVLIGAGSAVFSRGLMADLISAPDLGAWELRLVDTNPDALRVATRLAERMVEAGGEGARISVSGTTERREALPGAHVILTSVGVGGRPAWRCATRIRPPTWRTATSPRRRSTSPGLREDRGHAS
jgi:alpha-galactosidase